MNSGDPHLSNGAFLWTPCCGYTKWNFMTLDHSIGEPNSDWYNGTQTTVSTAIADQTLASPTAEHSNSSTA